jgi:hypothetical protein
VGAKFVEFRPTEKKKKYEGGKNPPDEETFQPKQMFPNPPPAATE